MKKSNLYQEDTKLSLTINLIDKYWRASNYVTVAQMYLKDNLLLKRPLMPEHVKEIVPGHWGTSPGINFIYAHLNSFISRKNVKMSLIIGPGHAACALISNLYLEESLGEYYSNLQLNLKGLKELSKLFGHSNGFRSEISPHLPGVIHDGGELGYALSVAYGSVLDRPDEITVCVVGDGEAETGPTAAAWQSVKYINPNESGTVLPILHLNQFRMGGRSIFSSMSDEEIKSYFSGLGYDAIFVNGSHDEMYSALEVCYEKIKEIKKISRSNSKLSFKWPMIIFKSPKGWTGPSIEGTVTSHKNPLPKPRNSIELLSEWLKTYKPEELFNDEGNLNEEIKRVIPKGNYRLGKSLTRNNCVNQTIKLPSIYNYSIDLEQYKDRGYKNIKVLNEYLGNVFELNHDHKNFRIMSPDELVSNGLGELLKYESKGFNRFSAFDKNTSFDGRIMEILSEHTCQGWIQGYNQTGRYSILPTYEAFAPIFSSMVSQYSKFLYQSKDLTWRKSVPSLNYILTSLCWSNTYSHQNPEFINTIVSKNYSFVRCFFPIDANSLLACISQSLESKDQINVIVTSKRELPQWFSIEDAISNINRGITSIHFNQDSSSSVSHLVLASSGDFPARECKKAIELLSEKLPNINITFVPVSDITILGPREIYPHALSNEEFLSYFPSNVPVIYNFHGYPSTIKSLVFDRVKNADFTVIGYSDKGIQSAPDLYKMIENGVSHFQIIILMLEKLHSSGAIKLEQKDKLQGLFNEEMRKYYLSFR
jgi:xylulose-5-phosphate/fructose-6-phosphate phosphoketolase